MRLREDTHRPCEVKEEWNPNKLRHGGLTPVRAPKVERAGVGGGICAASVAASATAGGGTSTGGEGTISVVVGGGPGPTYAEEPGPGLMHGPRPVTAAPAEGVEEEGGCEVDEH